MIRDYVALDLEMTGLSPRKDAILEIGAVKVRDMEVTETYTAMVNPGFPVPEHVTELTGITTEMAQQGREIHTVLPEFLEFCGQSVILGHNIGFDFGFLQQNAANMGKTFPDMAIDTLAIARKFLPELPSRKLGDLCDYYHIRDGTVRATMRMRRAGCIRNWQKHFLRKTKLTLSRKNLLIR